MSRLARRQQPDLLARVTELVAQLHPGEVGPVVGPILNDLTRPLVRLLWDDYHAAGAPYGSDEDGLWRWATEQTT